jgi:hypothetical protein
LGDVPIDALEDCLGGESIGRHIITTFIIIGENPADLAGLDFWLDRSNNFLPRLLPRQRRITTVILAKNHFCEGLIVGTLKDGYVRKVPLPRAPRIQHTSHMTTVTQDTGYLAQIPCILTWSDLTRSLAGLGRRTLLPFSLALM